MQLHLAALWTLLAVFYYVTAVTRRDVVMFVIVLAVAVLWWINVYYELK